MWGPLFCARGQIWVDPGGFLPYAVRNEGPAGGRCCTQQEREVLQMANDQNKMRAGSINVAMDEEPVLWYDRKRVTLFALPWSFTQYRLTPSRLIINTGLLNLQEEEIRLYRIKDVSYSQTLGERVGGTGTLRIISTDASVPEIQLHHIKNARKVKDVISQAVEVSRRENGVRTSELIGGVMSSKADLDGDGIPDSGTALGPDMMPDFNGNGIDDRLE